MFQDLDSGFSKRLSLCLEVEEFGASFGEKDPFGFDYMFFRNGLFPESPISDFVLDMPMWDYWLPMEAITRNIELIRFTTPLGQHVIHDSDWGRHIFTFGNIFIEYLTHSMAGGVKGLQTGWTHVAAKFINYHHDRLRDFVKVAQTENNSDELVYERMGQLADYYDSLLQFAFRYISDHAVLI